MEEYMNAYPENGRYIDDMYYSDMSEQRKEYETFLREKIENGKFLVQEPKLHFDDFERIDVLGNGLVNSPDFAFDPENLMGLFMASRVNKSELSKDRAHRPLMYEKAFKDLVGKGADKYAVLAMLAKRQVFAKEMGEVEIMKTLMSAESALSIVKSPYDQIFEDMKDLNFLKEVIKNETNDVEVVRLQDMIENLQSRITNNSKKCDPDMLKRVASSKRTYINASERILQENLDKPLILSKEAMEDYKAAESVEKMTMGMEREIRS